PGIDTIMEVSTRIFLREQVTKLGLAPLTSMYFFGENQPNATGTDFRPEVHDSDGLSIHSGTGEWIWRPVVNPKRLLVSSFARVKCSRSITAYCGKWIMRCARRNRGSHRRVADTLIAKARMTA